MKSITATITLHILPIIVLANSLYSLGSRGDQQFNCPNNGIPKMDEATGKRVQCLPGRTSEAACGKGYSCFFSGFNYQCCPTAEEDYDYLGECPLGSEAVLTPDRKMMECNQKKQCPNARMFCSTHNSLPICCEISNGIRDDNPKQQNEARIKESFSPPNRVNGVKTIVDVSLNEDECPENTVSVLMDDGKMTPCGEEGRNCLESDMFCHITNEMSICCRKLDVTNTSSSEEGKSEYQKKKKQFEHKYALEESKLQKALDEVEAGLTGEEEEQQETVGKIEYKPAKSASYSSLGPQTQVVDNEVSLPRSRRIHDGELVKARAAKNFNGEPIFEENSNTPGGYRISEKLQRINSLRSNVEHKMKVQRYLLEQIKGGWPYDDKFYRPEDIAVIREGNHPTAIVHFQN